MSTISEVYCVYLINWCIAEWYKTLLTILLHSIPIQYGTRQMMFENTFYCHFLCIFYALNDIQFVGLTTLYIVLNIFPNQDAKVPNLC
jgi:hypothetical protein